MCEKDKLLQPKIESYDPASKKSTRVKGRRGSRKASRVIEFKNPKFHDLSKNMTMEVSKICGEGMIDDLPKVKIRK
jgi:hypothetical protein